MEKTELKDQLERLWNRNETEKEIAMNVTRQEVENVKDYQIQDLKYNLEMAEKTNTELRDQQTEFINMKEIIRDLENEVFATRADKDILIGKIERLQLENNRFKDEYESRYGQEICDLKKHYSGIEKAYFEMASSTQELHKILNSNNIDIQKLLSSSQKMNVDTINHNQSNSKQYVESTENPLSCKYSRTQSGQIDLKNPQMSGEMLVRDNEDKSEIWKLRCKLLTEKYFNIIKDMKQSLK
jgi:hypothetical protein